MFVRRVRRSSIRLAVFVLGLVLLTPQRAVSQSLPTISSVSPGRIAAGSASTVVNVVGTGFTNGMVVVISNSQSLITTFVSTTQLQAIIPNTVLTTPSLLQLTVYTGSATVGSATVSVYSLAPPRVTAINPSYV